jgi:hypothetical protein
VLPEPLKVTHETNHSLNTSGQDKGKQLNKTLLTIGLQYCVGCTVIVQSSGTLKQKCKATMKYTKIFSMENSWKSTFTCRGKNNNTMKLRKIDL